MKQARCALRRVSSLRVVVGNPVATQRSNRGTYIYEIKGEGDNAGASCIEIGNKENHAPGALAVIPGSAPAGKHRNSTPSQEVFLGTDTDFVTFLSLTPDTARFSSLSREKKRGARTHPINAVKEDVDRRKEPCSHAQPTYCNLIWNTTSRDEATMVAIAPASAMRRLRSLSESHVPQSATSPHFDVDIESLVEDNKSIAPYTPSLLSSRLSTAKSLVADIPRSVEDIAEELRDLRALGFDFDTTFLAELDDDLLRSPWTAFRRACKDGLTHEGYF